MSDKPQHHPLSFDEIMQSVEQKPAEPPPPAKKPEPKKSAQPTFEEILEKADLSRPPPAEQPRPSRPPRQNQERKMPVVVRTPTLGAPTSEPPPVAGAPRATPASAYAPPTPSSPDRTRAASRWIWAGCAGSCLLRRSRCASSRTSLRTSASGSSFA